MPAIAEVEYADRGRERYFTPFAVVADADAAAARLGGALIARVAGAAVIDAFEDDAACRTLLTEMLAGRPIRMRHGVAGATVYRMNAIWPDCPFSGVPRSKATAAW